MKLLLSMLFSCLLATGCNKEAPEAAKPLPDPNPTEPTEEGISYLALGDSYTIGHGVQTSERFPVQLAKALKSKGVEVVETKIIATTGWTTADLKRGIAAANAEQQPWDLVSLLIGVNNQYQGKSLEEYRTEFRELLHQAIALAGGNKNRVLVLSIPDWGYTPFGSSNQAQISAEIDKFNAANKEITTSMGVSYFDITPISRQGLADPTLVAGDGLHPSGKMYGLWVELMLQEVLQKVK